MIKRRDLIISYIIIFAGFFLLIFTMLLYPDIENKENLEKIFVLISFALIIISGIYKSMRCKCPYCDAGKLFNVSTYIWKCDTLKSEFTCPECGKRIKIEK